MSKNVITSNKMKKESNDIYFTPQSVAEQMVEIAELKPGDKVLDPCRGLNKVIYNAIPEHCIKDWAELSEGKDFYDIPETEKYDAIIFNPPFSQIFQFLSHVMKLTDKFVFIINTQNLILNRMRWILNSGFGITGLYLCEIDWWFGSQIIVKCERNKPTVLEVAKCKTYCDICGTNNCQRGRGGRDPNHCPKLNKSAISITLEA